MKFQIGHVFNLIRQPTLSINFPGIGVVKAEGKDEEGFECIVLDRMQLKKLKRQIEKELEKGNGKKSIME